ncbi:hypothetical protein FRC08_001034 [Ceratobasidium sp. 394]|nr:hypothetical protein FRC08_001034 [Ceratobasidium sp. 394]
MGHKVSLQAIFVARRFVPPSVPMFKILIAPLSIFALGLSSVLAGSISNETIPAEFICGFSISDDLVAEAEADFAAKKISLDTRAEYAANIQVFWHSVQWGPGM